ncbi:rho GTPase-activating protein 6-like isoform X2 [Brienomyrus brachyistius]|nr:rho GTPase-activating protein 6-like isoform X2 [Brienomyrus brachyistius]
MLTHGVRLRPVPIQSLSEVERARLQEVACAHLEERELDFKISIPRAVRKRTKSLRRRFDSFSKERKDREAAPKAFGIPLVQVIANDRAHKRRQDALKESQRDSLELEASLLHFQAERQKQPGSDRAWCGPAPSRAAPLSAGTRSKLPSLPTPDSSCRTRRRGGLSVDSISDLVESQSCLLEALQLSHPYELDGKRAADRAQARLSLNPIYRQVPRLLELCCGHIEAHGLHTVGIFRVGSSKKRVRQLREDFDRGTDVVLDEEYSVHDVAALLKEFLRDMLDPLLPPELYLAFLHANTLKGVEQVHYVQLTSAPCRLQADLPLSPTPTALKGVEQILYLKLLLFLLPPANCDTLLRLLTLLHTVHEHAEDSTGPGMQQVPGNKMTAANLAVIFGPNLLQKERGSEKDSSPQVTGIEDSAAIISVTLQLIQNHKHLFMVPVAFQQEVLVRLIQTDPDIIVYLLRRKLSTTYPATDDDAGGCSVVRDSPEPAELSNGGPSPLDPTVAHFQGPREEISLSSEVIFSAPRHSQIRKYAPDVRPGKSMARIRQFHSHHNLLSLARPSCRPLSEDREEAGPAAERTVCFSLGEDLGATQTPSPKDQPGVWAKDSRPAATTFWDLFTRKAPSSEAAL